MRTMLIWAFGVLYLNTIFLVLGCYYSYLFLNRIYIFCRVYSKEGYKLPKRTHTAAVPHLGHASVHETRLLLRCSVLFPI